MTARIFYKKAHIFYEILLIIYTEIPEIGEKKQNFTFFCRDLGCSM